MPRSPIFEVPERLNLRGEVLCAFDHDAAQAVAREIDALGVEAVAVCFLHAYVNPLHEVAMEEVLAPTPLERMSHCRTR